MNWLLQQSIKDYKKKEFTMGELNKQIAEKGLK